MFSLSYDLENVTKGIGVVTAAFAMIGGGVTLWDKVQPKEILSWAPEYFEISDGPADSDFDVIVAREKHRDDCEVTDFTLEVKDSKYKVWKAEPSIAVFSGPASDKIDKFGYSFRIKEDYVNLVAPGEAVLLARIGYECPEGHQVVSYPPDLTFSIIQ